MMTGQRRWTLLAAAVAVAAGATLGGAMPVAASPAAATSCTPIASAQVHSILGLVSSLQMRNTTDKSGPSVVHECNLVAWSGPTPTSYQASLQTAKSGHGAQVGIETWVPNKSSANVQTWKNTDYKKLTHEFGVEAATFPGLFTNAGWPAKQFKPSAFGYKTNGFVVQVQGAAKGLAAAAGCWWNDKRYTIVCLLDEEAASKPVANHLNELARIAVPKVLG
jgi:hypothetical protein